MTDLPSSSSGQMICGFERSVFSGLHQTYLVMRGAMGNLETKVVEGFEPGDARGGSFQIADLLSHPTAITDLDLESVYLLAWQSRSVTATLTAISGGIVLGTATVEVGNDPMQVKVDWNAIDQLAISYNGTLGFQVTDNFFFL